MTNSALSAIKAVGLKKTYTGRDGEVEAVRGVDLDVAPGEVFGFLGPNGAGKSTTVRMLTTLMTITSGTAHVAGVDVAADPNEARRKIGVALQVPGSIRGKQGVSCSPCKRVCLGTRPSQPPLVPTNCSNSSSSPRRPIAGSRATPAA